MNKQTKPVIVALDFPTLDDALGLVDQLDPSMCRLKVGKELFTRHGPACVKALVGRDFDVFLDLKFHDIPNTVAAACSAAADLGCWMVNIHASGGRAMMEAARAALASEQSPLLIAVTVLTSLDDSALIEVGQHPNATEQVVRLAQLAQQSGIDGVVCSPLELPTLCQRIAENFAFVTPGIRLPSATQDDQIRVATPASALAAGADYLVIGRPITRADDPLQALKGINAQCGIGSTA